jgi:hypothetical protein
MSQATKTAGSILWLVIKIVIVVLLANSSQALFIYQNY